jgi:hypothetical protein
MKWSLEVFSAKEKRYFPIEVLNSTFKVPLAPLLVTAVPPYDLV